MPQAGLQYARVNLDARLNNRGIDMRTEPNQGIFRIQSHLQTVRFFFTLRIGKLLA